MARTASMVTVDLIYDLPRTSAGVWTVDLCRLSDTSNVDIFVWWKTGDVTFRMCKL